MGTLPYVLIDNLRQAPKEDIRDNPELPDDVAAPGHVEGDQEWGRNGKDRSYSVIQDPVVEVRLWSESDI